MTINGKTTEIELKDLLEAGAKMGIKERRCKDIINEISMKVGNFKSFAEQAGINENTYLYINTVIESNMIKI